MIKLLSITPGLFFDPSDELTRLEYTTLSDAGFSGYVLTVVYKKKYMNHSIGNFNLLTLYLPRFLQGYGTIRGLVRAVYYSLFCVMKAIQYRHAYDISVGKDTFKTGALCYLIKLVTNKPYIVEVAGNYIRSFAVNEKKVGLLDRLKQKFVLAVSPSVLDKASAIKLLYKTQIDDLTKLQEPEKVRVFHDISALDHFRPSDSNNKTILTVGHPWHLKGMDTTIKAFNQIKDKLPEYRLLVVGYCPDPTYYKQLSDSNPNICLYNEGLPYHELFELFESCSMFVLASRTEAMGRVLLEAMASRKPIIASAVDGIPRIIQDGNNGLLIEPEDVNQLSEKMLFLANNNEYASRLASKAYEDVHSRFSVNAYISKYQDLIKYALRA